MEKDKDLWFSIVEISQDIFIGNTSEYGGDMNKIGKKVYGVRLATVQNQIPIRMILMFHV